MQLSHVRTLAYFSVLKEQREVARAERFLPKHSSEATNGAEDTEKSERKSI